MPREKLSDRRLAYLINFEHDRVHYIAAFSRFDDGRLAELFLDVGYPAKPGAPIEQMARDMAVALSLALQHGVSAEEILAALSQEKDGTMRGPLGAALKLALAFDPSAEGNNA